MTEKQVFNQLKADYPGLVHDRYPFPKPYKGSQEVKAIILGADPTRMVNRQPQVFNTVFELDNEKSPYFRSIKRNIDLIEGISMEEVFVQNLCRNYFTRETSQNKDWVAIARRYWASFLVDELNDMFPASIPVLITTEFILKACLKVGKADNAKRIYTDCISISGSDNLLGREMIACYRHHRYTLANWMQYRQFVSNKVKSTK